MFKNISVSTVACLCSGHSKLYGWILSVVFFLVVFGAILSEWVLHAFFWRRGKPGTLLKIPFQTLNRNYLFWGVCPRCLPVYAFSSGCLLSKSCKMWKSSPAGCHLPWSFIKVTPPQPPWRHAERSRMLTVHSIDFVSENSYFYFRTL